MHRIDTSTRDLNKHGTGKDGFRSGDVAGEEPTDLTADWHDAVQEEPATVVEAAGLTLDKTDHTQLLQALRYLAALRALMNWEACVDASAYWAKSPRGADFDPISGLWVVAGDTDGAMVSKDDARNFAAFDTGMASTVGIEDVAIGGSSSAVCVGNSATLYQRASILSGSWGTVTAPGSPTYIQSIKYDVTNSRHIIVGQKAASAPYIATANDATGTAFTDRSAGIPAGFSGLPFGSIAIDGSGNAVASCDTAHTKVAYSTDGGVTWSESTTTLVSGQYDVAYSEVRGLFVAVRVDSYTANHTYTSPDGDVWTLVASAAIGFDATHFTRGKAVKCVGSCIIVLGQLNSVRVLAISIDGGATWTPLPLDAGNNAATLARSRTGGRLLALGPNTGLRSGRWELG